MSKILVIDDSKSWLALTQNYLNKAGYESVSADTGQAGLRLAHDLNPDLILLDWHLPDDISGLDVLKTIKTGQASKNIPIIMLSSVRQKAEDEAVARRAGADLFLTKDEILEHGRGESVLLRRIEAILICNKCGIPSRLSDETSKGVAGQESEATPGFQKRFSIFLIDDDPEFLDYAGELLKNSGYIIHASGTGNTAAEKIKTAEANLAIIDFELPGINGLEICRQLKSDRATRAIPTMILTGRANKQNWLASIRYGADLFYPKPINQEEFLQSVEALLSRITYENTDYGKITTGAFTINPATHTIIVSGREFSDLTTKPFDLAYLLVQNRPKIMSRNTLMRRLKMPLVRDNEINVLVHQLRKHLRPFGAELFKTLRGQGYYFDDSAARRLPQEPRESEEFSSSSTKIP